MASLAANALSMIDLTTPVEVTLEHVRRAGWREKRIVREADVVTTYARELPASVALVFAESDPDP